MRTAEMPKPAAEFFPMADIEWTPVRSQAEGLRERLLAVDEQGGVATRVLQFEPGADTRPDGVQVHDFWEEVYILEGAIHDLTLNETFGPGMYACRPPGMAHGPWRSPEGCTTFEVRYRW
jgi:hypothetical protein